ALAQDNKITPSLLWLAEGRNHEPVTGNPLHDFDGIDPLDSNRRWEEVVLHSDGLNRHIFQQRAELRLRNKTVSRRFLPCAGVRVEPSIFQVQNQILTRNETCHGRCRAPHPLCLWLLLLHSSTFDSHSKGQDRGERPAASLPI